MVRRSKCFGKLVAVMVNIVVKSSLIVISGFVKGDVSAKLVCRPWWCSWSIYVFFSSNIFTFFSQRRSSTEGSHDHFLLFEETLILRK